MLSCAALRFRGLPIPCDRRHIVPWAALSCKANSDCSTDVGSSRHPSTKESVGEQNWKKMFKTKLLYIKASQHRFKDPSEKRPVTASLVGESFLSHVHSLSGRRDDRRPGKKIRTKPAFAECESKRHFNVLFQSYVEACELTGNFGAAMDFFRMIPTSPREKLITTGRLSNTSEPRMRKDILDISSYHALLLGLARRGDFEEIKRIWRCMLDDGLSHPDSQCFAAVYICIGVLKVKRFGEDQGFGKFVDFVHRDMLEKGVSFHDIFTDCHFRSNDRSMLLKGIQVVDGRFNPAEVSRMLPPPVTAYDNFLLTGLNSRSTDELVSPLKSVLDAKGTDLKAMLKRQIEIEKQGFLDIPSVTRKTVLDDDLEKVVGYSDVLCRMWKERITVALEDRIKRLTEKRQHSRDPVFLSSVQVSTFLKLLDLEELADVVVDEIKRILRLSETFTPCVSVLQKQFGIEIYKRFRMKQKVGDREYMNKHLAVLEDCLEWFENPTDGRSWCLREAYEDVLRSVDHEGPSLHVAKVEWPFALLMTIGREILNVIMQDIVINTDANGRLVIDGIAVNVSSKGKVTTMPVEASSVVSTSTCPALFKIYRSRKNHMDVEEVKPHPTLAKLFACQKHQVVRFSFNELPMLTPPLPWLNSHAGGYLLHSSDLVRVSEMTHATESFKNKLHGRLTRAEPVFDSLNLLGSTPWKVHKDILKLATDAFTKQEEFEPFLDQLSIPRCPDFLSAPVMCADIRSKMSNKNDPMNVRLSAEEIEKYHAFVAERHAFNKLKSECFSMWCDVLYRLSLANHFSDDVLFFPHNIDFRGRVYPIPPHFNHMGGDLVRSLLVFAEGKRLGANGLNWLKLHIVNLTGEKKKSSVKERLEYADESLEDILDSADRPFDGKGWWLRFEAPWQTLATCIEIRNAVRCENPQEYVCHLPIHQDGSCNGLQHYAALGRDVLGAESVNLVPADRPQDVYNEIVTIVERRRCEDEKKGVAIASALKGFITRKVIKQTVMTTVYGVTKYGAKLQIARQLENLEEFPVDAIESSSRYLAQKTFESLNEMFEASQDIQAWFTECANAICGTFHKTIEWETPLGLPVIHPYLRQTGKQIRMKNRLDVASLISGSYEKAAVSSSGEKPNTRKQRNAFPPNFIHSLDSSHMMLTALHLWNRGVTFASVHDCYWTHASTVEIMNAVCRDQFVSLHSQPILEDLSKFFIDSCLPGGKDIASDLSFRKAMVLFKSIPPKGSLDLSVVKDSVYFFS